MIEKAAAHVGIFLSGIVIFFFFCQIVPKEDRGKTGHLTNNVMIAWPKGTLNKFVFIF